MKLKGSIAFVSGANRGLGLAFAEELLARGASHIYVGARDAGSFRDLPKGLIPVEFDVNDPASIQTAAARCGDVDLLVNNAGIARLIEGTLDPKWIDTSREIAETNFYGIVLATQAFAPVLRKNGGGALINVLSDAVWFAKPALSAYSASKSAAWSYTNAARIDLVAQGTQVLAMHVGFLDTDMTKGLDVPKTKPRVAAAAALDALESGESEVLVDAGTQQIKRSLSSSNPYYLEA